MNIENYLHQSGKSLEDYATYEDLGKSEKKLKKELRKVSKELADFQNRMYAHNKYSVLICIQGMDTAGKDSMIREIFKEFNVRGMVTHSFKVPTYRELQHDYLWRHYIALPERGKFGIFNRTHYENVLVTRVHPQYILNENIPGIDSVEDITDAFWEQRFESIRNFESHIARNGTIIFKFFLHLSKEEQRQRLLRRLDKPSKNWKFSADDLKERAHWDEYQNYYQEALDQTTDASAPWYVVPADSKEGARLIVAKILQEKLSAYTDVQNPTLDDKTKANLEEYRRQLHSEK